MVGLRVGGGVVNDVSGDACGDPYHTHLWNPPSPPPPASLESRDNETVEAVTDPAILEVGGKMDVQLTEAESQESGYV